MIDAFVIALTILLEAAGEPDATKADVCAVIANNHREGETWAATCFRPGFFSCWTPRRRAWANAGWWDKFRLDRDPATWKAWLWCVSKAVDITEGHYEPSTGATRFMTLKLWQSGNRYAREIRRRAVNVRESGSFVFFGLTKDKKGNP